MGRFITSQMFYKHDCDCKKYAGMTKDNLEQEFAKIVPVQNLDDEQMHQVQSIIDAYRKVCVRDAKNSNAMDVRWYEDTIKDQRQTISALESDVVRTHSAVDIRGDEIKRLKKQIRGLNNTIHHLTMMEDMRAEERKRIIKNNLRYKYEVFSLVEAFGAR